MTHFRLALFVWISLCFAGAALAQSSSKDRLDLGALGSFAETSPSPYSQIFVGFRDTEVRCPEQHGAVEIRHGLLSLHRSAELQMRSFTLAELGRGTRPLDDHQWQHQVGNSECSITLNIKLQLRTESGEWRPAILPWLSRPSITMEAKKEWIRNALARARERPRVMPPPPPSVPVSRSIGGAGSTSAAFFFEEIASDQPRPKCFHAIGTYDINQRGVAFAFFGGLSDVNRFVVERNEINRYATRLNFIGGECRLQITVSAATWYNFDWAPLEID